MFLDHLRLFSLRHAYEILGSANCVMQYENNGIIINLVQISLIIIELFYKLA